MFWLGTCICLVHALSEGPRTLPEVCWWRWPLVVLPRSFPHKDAPSKEQPSSVIASSAQSLQIRSWCGWQTVYPGRCFSGQSSGADADFPDVWFKAVWRPQFVGSDWECLFFWPFLATRKAPPSPWHNGKLPLEVPGPEPPPSQPPGEDWMCRSSWWGWCSQSGSTAAGAKAFTLLVFTHLVRSFRKRVPKKERWRHGFLTNISWWW